MTCFQSWSDIVSVSVVCAPGHALQFGAKDRPHTPAEDSSLRGASSNCIVFIPNGWVLRQVPVRFVFLLCLWTSSSAGDRGCRQMFFHFVERHQEAVRVSHRATPPPAGLCCDDNGSTHTGCHNSNISVFMQKWLLTAQNDVVTATLTLQVLT